jgi:hypothetical protein
MKEIYASTQLHKGIICQSKETHYNNKKSGTHEHSHEIM